MKRIVLPILLIFCSLQLIHAQTEDGVIALDIPARNSLMFNRSINIPTFSFVREQNKYITVSNKRELVQIEDAPQTYLINYSGRFGENIGAGISFFQQNYGVLTAFGGIVNFAYNAQLAEESNLTFGINIGAYKSGLNSGSVQTNFDDPALANIPSNFLLTANPGLNYGTGFLDFGVSLNNIITYNFQTSNLVEDNPKRGVQGHFMYTGYFGGYGFFADSRFSTLARTEFQKDNSIYSAVVMLTVPKGIWAQVGYNTQYGASGGLGVNITPQIAIEYNYERPLSGLSNLGAAHEITLAYRFKNNNYYDYSRDDELAGIFTSGNKTQRKSKKTKTAPSTIQEEEVTAPEPTAPIVETEAPVAAEVQPETEDQNQEAEADDQERIAAEEAERVAAEEQTRLVAEEQARITAQEQAKAEDDEKARIAAEAQQRQQAEAQARLAAEEQARVTAETQARLAAEEQQRLATEAATKLANEEQAKIETAEQERLALEAAAQLEAEKEAREKTVVQTRIAERRLQEEAAQNPTDAIGKEMTTVTKQAEEIRVQQASLLERLNKALSIKNEDLRDLKEENDLSEQGKVVAPKAFKSVTAENLEIEVLKEDIKNTIDARSNEIDQLESLYKARLKAVPNKNDESNVYFRNTIANLKNEQVAAERSRAYLISTLKQVAKATAFERKRRIKRASFNNENQRFTQNKAQLNVIKQNTRLSEVPLTVDDFDFGEERNTSIQILKNVANTENGYYLIVAVHNSAAKRDDFLTNVVASGNKNIDFFFDVNTSKYYIYSKKVSSIEEANSALKAKGNDAYNNQMSIIKIEN